MKERALPENFVPFAAVILAAIVFSPGLKYGFINYDDPIYLTNNFLLREPFSSHAALQILTTPVNGMWSPLAVASFFMEAHIFGVKAPIMHLTAIWLHILNIWLMWKLLALIKLPEEGKMFAVFAFAIHPVQVESVIWISERKGILCATFCLLSSIHYGAFQHQPNSKRNLSLSLAFWIAALMSKTSAIVLPIALMIAGIAHEHYNSTRHDLSLSTFVRTARAVLKQAPMYYLLMTLIGLIYMCVAIIIPYSSGIVPQGVSGLFRVISIPAGFQLLIIKACDSRNLSVLYARPDFWTYSDFMGLIVGVLCLLLFLVRRRDMRIPIGSCVAISAILLLPSSGIVPYGSHVTANRYLYLPICGLALSVGTVLFGVVQSSTVRKLSYVAAIAWLTMLCSKEMRIWNSSQQLWEEALRNGGESAVSRHNLAMANFEIGNVNDGLKNLRLAFAEDPRSPLTGEALATFLSSHGKPREARVIAEALLRDNPRSTLIMLQLAQTTHIMNRYAEAREWIEKAKINAPDEPSVYYASSRLHLARGSPYFDAVLAESEAQHAVKLTNFMDPRYLELYAIAQKANSHVAESNETKRKALNIVKVFGPDWLAERLRAL